MDDLAKVEQKIKACKMLSYRLLANFLAVRTGLEPATSAVTGRHSNQLNYRTILPRFHPLCSEIVMQK